MSLDHGDDDASPERVEFVVIHLESSPNFAQ